MRFAVGVADWIILCWTLFVLVVYVGGYLFPGGIGIYTRNLGAVYAVVLISAASMWALRLLPRNSTDAARDRNRTPKSRAAPKKK